MKKIFFIIFGIIVLIGLGWAGIFYWQNLRGVGPAIRSVPDDIAEIIEKSSGEEANEPILKKDEPLILAQNNTEFPLQLPDGFSISIFAKDLGPARVMTRDSAGNLLVSITKENRIVALPDYDNDGVADEVRTIAEGNRPHGLAFRGETLYVAETNQVVMYDYDAENLKVSNKRKIIDLPGGGNHFSRTIMFASDGRLLTSVGSTCNVCNEKDWRRAKILVSNADGSDLKVFASGLRNAVFMVLHPVTAMVWATEMGRDLIGDDIPPDEINIVEEGKNYGWPLCYGKNVLDTDFHKDDHVHIRADCTEPFEIPSSIDLQAHSAPLGLAFIPEEGWPEEYWHDLLVAYHGSWNRTVPTGYKIMRFKLNDQGKYQGREDFIAGWLTEENRALGRPADILIEPDGTLFISDDKAGVIYRVVYNE